MSNATWPGTLPTHVFEQGYSEKLNDQTLESTVDVGSPKIRRRFTKQIRTFSVQMRLTPTQKTTFEGFWQTTLLGGSLAFNWVHPLTRASTTFRFRKPAPSFSSIGGSDSIVSFTMETV
jgi:hypothetical protein